MDDTRNTAEARPAEQVPGPAAWSALIGPWAQEPGGLLPALHALQDALGWIPDAALPVVARVFRRSVAEVHGVVSFYHHFRRHPPAPRILAVCRGESCQACGASPLWNHAQALASDTLTVEAVFCLGLCAQSPAASLQAGGIEQRRVRLTPGRLDAWLQTSPVPGDRS